MPTQAGQQLPTAVRPAARARARRSLAVHVHAGVLALLGAAGGADLWVREAAALAPRAPRRVLRADGVARVREVDRAAHVRLGGVVQRADWRGAGLPVAGGRAAAAVVLTRALRSREGQAQEHGDGCEGLHWAGRSHSLGRAWES